MIHRQSLLLEKALDSLNIVFNSNLLLLDDLYYWRVRKICGWIFIEEILDTLAIGFEDLSSCWSHDLFSQLEASVFAVSDGPGVVKIVRTTCELGAPSQFDVIL